MEKPVYLTSNVFIGMETWIILNNKTSCCSEKMANSESPSVAQRALCGCVLALAQSLRPGSQAAAQLGGGQEIVLVFQTREKLSSSRKKHHPRKNFLDSAHKRETRLKSKGNLSSLYLCCRQHANRKESRGGSEASADKTVHHRFSLSSLSDLV